MILNPRRILYATSLCLSILMTGCGGCSESGLREKTLNNSNRHSRTNEFSSNSQETSTVKMENENGVKYIWVVINNLNLRFIFDTGASSICISSAEATVLYRQGTLLKEDIEDVQYFQDATGNISTGTKINLRTVKIGNKTLNDIEAIVIANEKAPLLLGQSALEKFGKITIDNNENEIRFD